MDFYLQLLKEQYEFMESQYEQRINQPPSEEEKRTCLCGLVWIDECSGCEEGESANWGQLELTMNI
jgi:hypothetical protein